jgi:hypothetical protein
VVGSAVDLTREEARELARRELSRSEYHRDDPSLFERAATWLRDQITELIDRAVGVTPSGWFGLVVVLLLIAVVLAVILVRTGGVRRTVRSDEPLLGGRRRTAAEHRAEAERAVATGAYDLAVRERLRAIAADLEARGLLDPRPGRTADELVTDAGAALPTLAAELRAAGRVFDDVWYGGRTATADSYAVVRDADEHVRDARAVLR